jgi:two-component sensor histidine kinase
MKNDPQRTSIDSLFEGSDLSVVLDDEIFKQFLDEIPIAVAVSKIGEVEKVIYANLEFERLSGQLNATVLESGWRRLQGEQVAAEANHSLGEAITKGRDYLGSFDVPHGESMLMVDAWSNIIEDDDGKPAFRLVALIAAPPRDPLVLDELEEQIREKDVQLQELQHRVKNNLQMITALIRMEARTVADRSTGEGFVRLAGRVEALGLLYRALSASTGEGVVDLGIYLSEIASAVMRAHALEGIHLDLQVDTWPVSLDVAMPTGLVVNELLTNTLKHAFQGREGGTVTLHSATDAAGGCRVLVGDDGLGLPEGFSWPRPGKLSSLIVRSLIENAKARMNVRSAPGEGMRVEITFIAAETPRLG